MSTVLNNPERVGTRTWRYTWTGTAPFRIFDYESYQWRSNNFEHTEITIYGQSDLQPPPIEVFDSTETGSTPEGVTYPASITIQWRGKAGAYEYIIRDDSNSIIARISERGKGYYSFAGLPADDGAEIQYSVNAADELGNESTNAFQVIDVIRNPDYVKIELSYDAGTGDLDITEAVE